MKWRRGHDAVYWFDLKIAQHRGLVFWQSMLHAIILNDSMPAECLLQVLHKTSEGLYPKIQSEPQVAQRSQSGPILPKISQPNPLEPLSQTRFSQYVVQRIHCTFSKLARGDLLRMAKLAARIGERYQGVHQAEVHYDHGRRNELDLQCSLVFL